MGLTLENVVPWGRSFSEYVRMFALTVEELNAKILDCAGGPACFNAEMKHRGNLIISCDPIYQFSEAEIKQRIWETYPIIVEGVKQNLTDYVWQEIKTPDQLGQVRMAAMRIFLEDLTLGVQEGRYLTDALPNLSFESQQFDLALCSHLLFTYSDQLSLNFHLESIKEMCRVAKEVRIFPILKISGEPSPYLNPVLNTLEEQGFYLEIKTVVYEFQKGGNQLLLVGSNQSEKPLP